MFIPCYMMLSRKMQKSTLDLVKALTFGRSSRNHYNIKVTVKICFVETITFSDQSGESVANHTIPYFFTYRYSQTILLVLILQHVHHQKPICVLCSVLIYNFKIFIFL